MCEERIEGPSRAEPYPWWLANQDTWVPTSGVPIAVEDMTPEHIEGVCMYLAKLLEPENNENLRGQMDARYLNTLSASNGACDDGAEQFNRWVTGMDAHEDEPTATAAEVVTTAYPAAVAIIKRAKQLKLDIAATSLVAELQATETDRNDW